MSILLKHFDSKRHFTTRHGIEVENIKEKKTVTIWALLEHGHGYSIVVTRSFGGGIDAVCQHFDLPQERALDWLTPDHLYQQFLAGEFAIKVTLGKRYYLFQMVDVNSGADSYLTFQIGGKPDSYTRIQRAPFYEPGDYLKYSRMYHRDYERLRKSKWHFDGRKKMITQLREGSWITKWCRR